MAYDPTLGTGPDDWYATKLGVVCKRNGANFQTGPFGSQPHASDYIADGIPTIMPVNIRDNRLIEDGVARITQAEAERLSKQRVRPGDMVYSRRRDV